MLPTPANPLSRSSDKDKHNGLNPVLERGRDEV